MSRSRAMSRARAMSRSRSALRAASVAAASVLLCAPSASACTNLLVSQGASHDASTILAYNADSGSLYGSLGHYPATDNNPPNATREVWDWDDSVFLGVIPEARRTFNVIGNANERGLVIGETTFGGLPELDCHGTGGVMDYGSLIWIALQRAETCAEAIDVIDSLVQTHGYASDGESFSCVDGAEAWLMELVGKGKHERGAVWVATRVPEGAVLAHANQARTTTFDMNDPVNVRYSPDVVSFALVRLGGTPSTRAMTTSTLAPRTTSSRSAARGTETRACGTSTAVWRVRRLWSRTASTRADTTSRIALPLFAHPAARLDVESVMAIMRTKLEDTWFDTRGTHRADVGAGPGHSAYRFRPLTWRDSAGRAFVNERTVATQQTAWNFVAESRLRFPRPIAAIQWWAPDDSGTALRVPVYGGAARVPYNFAGRRRASPRGGGGRRERAGRRRRARRSTRRFGFGTSRRRSRTENERTSSPPRSRANSTANRVVSSVSRVKRTRNSRAWWNRSSSRRRRRSSSASGRGRVRAMARRFSQTLRRDARRVSHHAERNTEVRPREIRRWDARRGPCRTWRRLGTTPSGAIASPPTEKTRSGTPRPLTEESTTRRKRRARTSRGNAPGWKNDVRGWTSGSNARTEKKRGRSNPPVVVSRRRGDGR